MTRGERVVAFIEKFCRVPEGKLVGKPLVLDPFQVRFILAVYDNDHTTLLAILSMARKNGKTALIACLLLAHLVGPEAVRNSQIVSGAMSRDQAALVFKLAVKMVNLNPNLSKIIKIVPSGKHLVGLPMNVEFTALAAESKTALGQSPILAILDETGQVVGPVDPFVDAITTAQGAYEAPLLIVISTQAANDADLLSVWIDDARESQDPQVVCHVYEAPEDAALDDEEGWLAANPAMGNFRSRQDVAKQASRAIRMPSSESTFRNLTLNQRVSVVSPFVSRETWKACSGDPGRPRGVVYGGLDLSSRTDLTALILVGEADDALCVWSYFWTPEKGLRERAKADRVPYDVWVRQGYLRTTPGATVDYDYVAGEIGEILDDVDSAVIAFDRWRMDLMEKELLDKGITLPLEPFGQGYKDMSPAIDSLESEILNGRLAHGDHPVLTMCAANAVVTSDPAGNRKLDKHKASGRIDGMVALTMAVGVIGTVEESHAALEVW